MNWPFLYIKCVEYEQLHIQLNILNFQSHSMGIQVLVLKTSLSLYSLFLLNVTEYGLLIYVTLSVE